MVSLNLLKSGISTTSLLALVFVSLFLIPFGMISHDAFAMGTGPGRCNNEYDGPVTVAKINNGTQTFDAMANPGVTFELSPKGTYYLIWIIHTPLQNRASNSNPGTIWGDTDLQGFANGFCEGTAYPDSNFTEILSWSCGSNRCNANTYWGTLVNSFSYGLSFVTPSNSTTTSTTVPGLPTNISPIPVSMSQIDLMWNAPSNSTVTGYKIERSSDDANWSTISSNTNSTLTRYFDSGLLPYTTYYYRVSAINNLGSSPPSSVSSGTTFVFRPDLTVQAQDSNGAAVSGLTATLFRNGTKVASGPTPATFFLSSGSMYSVNVADGGDHDFDYWADTGSKNATRQISISNNTVITAIEKTVPNPPTNLAATPISPSQVDLSWTTPSNNGYPVTNYNVYRGTSGTGTFLVQIGNVTSYNDTSVTNGQKYFYTVTAVNSAGESLPSNEASATPATVPNSPTNLTATTVSPTQLNLSWTAPANNGGSTITGYMIERSIDNGTTWSTLVANTGSASTAYSDTGLASSTTYMYRVSAINPVGTGSTSNTTSAVTDKTGIVMNNAQSTSGTTSSSNTITLSNFNAGAKSNSMLVVGVSANNNDVASITFGGISLQNVAHTFYNNDAEFWYLTNPSGTGDIIVTMNGPTQAVVGAYSFSGVNQTLPIPTHIVKHNTNPNSPNVTITTKYVNDWVLDLPSIYGGSTLGSPTCTQQWDLNVPDQITGASSSTMVQSPSTVTCKWTASSGDLYDDVAVEINAAR